MKIISVSVNDEILREMDELQTDLGFSGRSEVIRAGIRTLAADKKEKDDLEGDLSCVLLVTHDEDSEGVVTRAKHLYEDIITTTVHNRLRKEKCLEVFVLQGKADKIRKIARMFQTSKDIDYIKLIAA
ncbi:MAG: CopG family ribbon-helix-helix protein [Candidatus Bathyarchaeia archaeon]